MDIRPRVCVIGAGAIGLSSALQLSHAGADVTVLDKAYVASGSSGLSVGIVGTQLLEPLDIDMRVWGLQFMQRLEVSGLDFSRVGYLRLAHDAGSRTRFEVSAERQRGLGLDDVSVLERTDIARLIPDLYVDDVECGLFGPSNGFIDGHLYCGLLAELVGKAGGRILVRSEVVAMRELEGVGIELAISDGSRFECDFVVNAAGAWAGRVASRLGVPLEILPEKAQAAVVETGRSLPYEMPLVMDFVPGIGGSGLCFRHERDGQLIVELHTETVSRLEDPDCPSGSVSPEWSEAVAQLLLTRLPGLRDPRLGRGWTGLYPMTRDGHPCIGPYPDHPAIIAAAGLGGYGIQLSPATGRTVTEWIMTGAPETFPEARKLAPTTRSHKTDVPARSGTAHGARVPDCAVISQRGGADESAYDSQPQENSHDK